MEREVNKYSQRGENNEQKRTSRKISNVLFFRRII